MDHFIIDNQWVSLEKLDQVLASGAQISISEDAKAAILKCRTYLDEKVAKSDRLIYGVNTGFGSLCDTAISSEDLEQLQRNLVLSHACGMGDRVPQEIVRRLLILKIMGLSHGASGVQLETVERLVFFYNNHIYPVVFQQGSLGASGDLAPLAHLVLPLLGEGTVMFEGKEYTSKEINERFGLKEIALRSKEGLALLNGTQFMSAYGAHILIKAYKYSYLADLIGTISLEGFDGRIEPFTDLIHLVRPHKGQVQTAERMRDLLEDSEIIAQPKVHVQDPYSFRCIPQVHGATIGAFNHVLDIFMREINSVTDNPNVFPDEDLIVSGGNFHGQPLAISLDYLAIAMSELANISERRTYQLLSGQRDLPLFLVKDPGLHSGFMIPQYTAAGIVSENKQLCTPASVDSIVSSNGQEDHVSMGANAAVKAYAVVNNLYDILGIELLTACQALEFRRPAKSSEVIESIFHDFRELVPILEGDRMLYKDIHQAADYIRNNRKA